MMGLSRTAKYSAHRFRNISGVVDEGGWRGRWYGASLPQPQPQPQRRSPRKISKDERRALLLSYVNKYRAEHDGKFPSAADAIKNVGGGFYAIRTMIQELEYKSKTSSADVNDATQKKHFQDEGKGALPSSMPANNSSKHVQDIAAPSGQSDVLATQGDPLAGNGENVSHSCPEKADGEKIEEAQGPRSDFATDIRAFQEEIEENFQNYHENANGKNEKAEDRAKFVEIESHLLKGETEKVSPLSFGNVDEKKEQSTSEASLNSGGTKQEAQLHKLSPEAEKNATDVSSKQSDDAESPKQSTLWGSLKSFADDFIKMWIKS